MSRGEWAYMRRVHHESNGVFFKARAHFYWLTSIYPRLRVEVMRSQLLIYAEISQKF